jgi:hypothetical protein
MARKRSGRYGKLYADLLTDPKLTDLMSGRNGHRALAVHALSLAWCSQHLTDGHIPASTLGVLWGKESDADALVTARLWKKAPGGWSICGYEEANLTRARVAELRQEGEINACKRWMTEKGKTCSCGHHDETGQRDPNG